MTIARLVIPYNFGQGWRCAQCGTPIHAHYDHDTNTLSPASKYWSAEDKVPFCHPGCGANYVESRVRRG